MNIAIDISPLKTGHFLQHRVRGTGFYIENLRKSLLNIDKINNYLFFYRGEKIPKDADIVHYPYFEPFFLTLPFLKTKKTVVTVHDLTPLVFPKYFPKGLRGALKWQIQKRLLERADSVITDSNSSKKDILKFTSINPGKIKVIYLSAGEEFKKLDDRSGLASVKAKYNLPDKFVLYVGDVTWNKNIPRLIKAIKKNNIPLVLVGKALIDKDFDKENPWNQDLNEVQKMIEGDKLITKLGFVPNSDLTALYNLATVFVMPSLYEGFGLPVLEAMKCGCPVITTKEGSLEEIGEDAAYYVNPYDISDISNGIKKVYSNNEIASKLSKKGLEQTKKFSWEKTAKETINSYKELID